MRKVATIIVVVFLLSVVFMTSPVSGREYALEVGGFTAKSHDGNARLFNQETGMYNGNITTIELNDIETEDGMADDAWNDGTQGSIEPSEYDIYGWPSDAAGGNEKEPYFWESNPEEAGENVLFLAEYQFWDEKTQTTINYTWMSNLPARTKTPPEKKQNVVKYEPIPKPEINKKADEPVGSTWINVSIPYFKYTDFNISSDKPDFKGSFECFQSYAVFIKGGEFKSWSYIGNSRPDPRWNQEANPPLPATDTETNPNDYNTGRDYFLAKNLQPETDYQFLVRVNFQSPRGDDMGPVWGYGGGLGDLPRETRSDSRAPSGGSGTTFGSSGQGSVVPTGSDDDPPTVTIDSPTNGDDIDSTSVTIQWTGSDDNGIDHYEIRRNSGSWSDVGTSTSHIYSGLSEGDHTVDVMAYDTIGQTDMDSVTFEVDITNPTITITSPGDGDDIASSTVTVYWSGSDSGSGIDYYYARIDSGSWVYQGTATSETYSSLTEADHTVDVRAYDNAGNYNTDTVIFTVDLTGPSISISSPTEGEYIGSTSVTVEWSGSDANGIDHYETRIDSGGWINKGTSLSHEYTGLSEGGHTVDVRAYDPAGNYYTDSVSFTVDITNPTVSITTPNDGDYISDTSVTVEWTGSDANGIDHYETRIDSGGWIDTGLSTNHDYYGLSEGGHTVDVRAYDYAGNYYTDTISFTIDISDPSVTITSPSNLDVIEEYDVTVYWSGSDNSGGSGVLTYYIRIDGGGWVNKGLSTSHTYNGLSEGDHTVDVWIYDMAYNYDMDTVTFSIAHSNDVLLTTSGSSDGWNFLSTKLIPLDTSITAILDDPVDGIANNYSKVMWYDASVGDWKTYVPGRSSQYNDLTTWDRTMGLWIRMTSDDTLTIRGTEPTTTDITLYPGWNMAGYPSTITGNNGLPGEVTKIGIFNASREYNIEYNYTPSTYNFEPGKAYWIYNSESTSVTWTVDYA